jgi:hypothetical protein
MEFGKVSPLVWLILPPLVAFVPSGANRIADVFRNGTALSFPAVEDDEYREYVRYALSEEAGHLVISAQAAIPAGEPFIAWINFPFHLDFRRNPISDIDPAGLSTPWAHLPPFKYLFWDRLGYATLSSNAFKLMSKGPGLRERLVAMRTAQTIDELAHQTSPSQMVWKGKGIYVYKSERHWSIPVQRPTAIVY